MKRRRNQNGQVSDTPTLKAGGALADDECCVNSQVAFLMDTDIALVQCESLVYLGRGKSKIAEIRSNRSCDPAFLARYEEPATT